MSFFGRKVALILFLVFGVLTIIQPQPGWTAPNRPALLEFGAGHCISCKEMAKIIEELKADMEKGGPHEAAIRALVYIRMPENAVDERGFEILRRIRAERCSQITLSEFKQELREQYLMLRLDEHRAVEAIPVLLKGHEGEARQLFDYIRQIVTAGGPLGEEAQKRLAEVEQHFGASAPAGVLMQHYGFTQDNVIAVVTGLLGG